MKIRLKSAWFCVHILNVDYREIQSRSKYQTSVLFHWYSSQMFWYSSNDLINGILSLEFGSLHLSLVSDTYTYAFKLWTRKSPVLRRFQELVVQYLDSYCTANWEWVKISSLCTQSVMQIQLTPFKCVPHFLLQELCRKNLGTWF